MQDDRNLGTVDLFGCPVGRPKRSIPLSGAQRQARYRQAELNRAEARQKRMAHLADVTVARYMADADQDYDYRKELWLEFGRRLGFK